jgi:DNA (cytosine-5)-methyltransferase 1
MLNGLDLFSGIGGITLALQKYVRPICYVEIEPYCQSVIKSRIKSGQLPDAPIWHDIKSFDGKPLQGLVDVIYGGFPCQDISVAGHGAGLEGKRSGLFFEIMRLAKEIRPTFIFLENVPAITRRGLNTVCESLSALRYDCRWGMLSAFDLGAPHQRERWFLLAYSNSERPQKPKELDVSDPLRQRLQRQREKHKLQRPSDEEQTCGLRWWRVEPDVGRVVNGLPGRVDRIKSLGNAVVPAQVCEAFERLVGLTEFGFLK